MQELSRRTSFSGPKLIRLLARLTDADAPEPPESVSDRLSSWLGWTDAIALSAALNRAVQARSAGASVSCSAEERECARVRTALENTIVGKPMAPASQRRGQLREGGQGGGEAEEVGEYSTYRQRYLSLQKTMATNIGSLRGRLRGVLASTPGMAGLAAVDEVMEQGLSAREHSLLAHLPALLEGHFLRLRQVELAAQDDTQMPESLSAATPGAWLDVFRKDMQSVLLAELDIRLQPVEGLLDALRAS